MDDLPYIEQLDEAEIGFAHEALSLAGVSTELAEGFDPATWRLLGRYAYYALGNASSAIGALVHDSNTDMDTAAIREISGLLDATLTRIAHIVGDPAE